ncbi:MAG: hypothetical protein WC781_02935 [Candidatus Pacearchaeota archaeon]|jgi:hypothetical protein
MKSKKGFEMEAIGWVLLGLAVFVVMVIGIIILSGKGNNALDFIKNMFRFSR